MPYVIADPCIGSKDTSCVEVCPVDCIHPMPGEPGYEDAEQLYIDPTECIDCDACAEACPVDAVYSDALLPEQWAGSAGRNARWFEEHATPEPVRARRK